MKKKNRFSSLLLASLVLLGVSLAFTSCSDDDNKSGTDNPKIAVIKKEFIKMSYEDLLAVENGLKTVQVQNNTRALTIPEFNVKELMDSLIKSGVSKDSIYVKVYNISHKLPHLAKGNNTTIDNSGILLVPSVALASANKELRLVVSTTGTMVNKSAAPSEIFNVKENLFEPNSHGWLLIYPHYALSAAYGFAVLLPDYPGFGNSFGQCKFPVFESKPLVESVIGLTKAASVALQDEGYTCKKGIDYLGYSMGGYVAGAVAREIETNSSHELEVNLLMIGASHTDLKYLMDESRKPESDPRNFMVIPWALSGYRVNGYPDLNLNEILIAPLDSAIYNYFDGTHTDSEVYNELYPRSIDSAYTEAFINHKDTDTKFTMVNNILKENSLQAWKNKCEFYFIVPQDDSSIYPIPSKAFVNGIKDQGGNVMELSVDYNHWEGRIPYCEQTVKYMFLHK